MGEWRGRQSSLDPQTEHFLGLTDYILSDYVKRDGRSVNLYVAYYANQRTGVSPHSPAVCIPGNGWIITDLQRTHYASPDRSVSLPLNRVVIARGSDKQLVYYWFEQRGLKIANEYWSKLLLLRDALIENRTDGALVRLTTPIFAGETEAEADRPAAGVHPHRGARACALSAGPGIHNRQVLNATEIAMRAFGFPPQTCNALPLPRHVCACRLQLARGARPGLLREGAKLHREE